MKSIEVLRIALRNPIVQRQLASDGVMPEGATPETMEEAALKALGEMRAENAVGTAELIAAIEQIATEIYDRGFRAGAAKP